MRRSLIPLLKRPVFFVFTLTEAVLSLTALAGAMTFFGCCLAVVHWHETYPEAAKEAFLGILVGPAVFFVALLVIHWAEKVEHKAYALLARS